MQCHISGRKVGTVNGVESRESFSRVQDKTLVMGLGNFVPKS